MIIFPDSGKVSNHDPPVKIEEPTQSCEHRSGRVVVKHRLSQTAHRRLTHMRAQPVISGVPSSGNNDDPGKRELAHETEAHPPRPQRQIQRDDDDDGSHRLRLERQPSDEGETHAAGDCVMAARADAQAHMNARIAHPRHSTSSERSACSGRTTSAPREKHDAGPPQSQSQWRAAMHDDERVTSGGGGFPQSFINAVLPTSKYAHSSVQQELRRLHERYETTPSHALHHAIGGDVRKPIGIAAPLVRTSTVDVSHADASPSSHHQEQHMHLGHAIGRARHGESDAIGGRSNVMGVSEIPRAVHGDGRVSLSHIGADMPSAPHPSARTSPSGLPQATTPELAKQASPAQPTMPATTSSQAEHSSQRQRQRRRQGSGGRPPSSGLEAHPTFPSMVRSCVKELTSLPQYRYGVRDEDVRRFVAEKWDIYDRAMKYIDNAVESLCANEKLARTVDGLLVLVVKKRGRPSKAT